MIDLASLLQAFDVVVMSMMVEMFVHVSHGRCKNAMELTAYQTWFQRVTAINIDGYRAWTMLAEAYSHLVASLVNELASQHLAQNQSMRAFAKRILG